MANIVANSSDVPGEPISDHLQSTLSTLSPTQNSLHSSLNLTSGGWSEIGTEGNIRESPPVVPIKNSIILLSTISITSPHPLLLALPTDQTVFLEIRAKNFVAISSKLVPTRVAEKGATMVSMKWICGWPLPVHGAPLLIDIKTHGVKWSEKLLFRMSIQPLATMNEEGVHRTDFHDGGHLLAKFKQFAKFSSPLESSGKVSKAPPRRLLGIFGFIPGFSCFSGTSKKSYSVSQLRLHKRSSIQPIN